MRTIHIFDIDTTIADNTERALVLEKVCVQCAGPCIPSPVNGYDKCHTCGPTTSRTPQSAWDTFTEPERMMLDKPYKSAQIYIAQLYAVGAEVHFLTGRNENSREVTASWLKEHYGYDEKRSHLVLRQSDFRSVPASIYKESAFLALRDQLNSTSDLHYLYEDDPYVFSMYKKYGIVFKCPEFFDNVNPEGKPRNLEERWRR